MSTETELHFSQKNLRALDLWFDARIIELTETIVTIAMVKEG
jgi:hypothetical protein